MKCLRRLKWQDSYKNPMAHNRMQRIGDQIQRELAQLLILKTHDPRFHETSITSVDVSPDMANATIYVSVLKEDQIKETLDALIHAAGFFRRELAHSLNLRVTPKLHFVYDKSVAQANRLDDLINNLNITPEENNE